MSRLVALTRGARATGPVAASARCFQSSTVPRQAEPDLLTRIKSDLKDAMRAKDSFTSTVLRSLLSEQQYAAKAGSAGATDVSSILQKAIAKRQESSRQFRAAKPAREDLAEKEDREVGIIQKLLPEQMSVEELESVVKQVVEQLQQEGSSGKKMMGEVMKAVSAKVDKSRAPGSVVSEAVRRLLPKE